MPYFDTVTSSSSKDELFAGDFPVEKKPITILSGQNLSRGDVLGIVTASDKAVIVDSTNSDGSQAPKGVLLVDTDASGGDVEAVYAVTGSFNSSALSFGGTDTVSTHAAALEALNIYTHEDADAVQ